MKFNGDNGQFCRKPAGFVQKVNAFGGDFDPWRQVYAVREIAALTALDQAVTFQVTQTRGQGAGIKRYRQAIGNLNQGLAVISNGGQDSTVIIFQWRALGRVIVVETAILAPQGANPLDNPTHPAMLSPVAVCCGSAGVQARRKRRKQPRLHPLVGSGFLLRAWQVLLWASCAGGVMPCRFLVPGLQTRTVLPTLFCSREADLIRTRSFVMSHPVNVPALAHSIHPSVQLIEGRAVTSSVEVARVYGKQHKNVIRDIEKLLPELPAEHKLNFEPMLSSVEISNGATRDSKAYHLTRDGFTLLAMGFTGKKALAFKLAYIEAFNQMERELSGKAEPLPPPVPTRTLTFTVPQDETHCVRWLLDIDRQGNERVQRLAKETHVLSRDRLVRMLIQNPADLNLTLEERLSILGACLRGLSQAATASVRRLGIKPAPAPETGPGDVGSLGRPDTGKGKGTPRA